MIRPRQDAISSESYALYQSGMSLAQVAKARGVTRQTVYEMFRCRGLSLRTRTLQPTITYGGDTFAPDPNGYYRRTHGDRKLLHQLVWVDNHGPIPPGYDIHHTDENKANNDCSNLECLTPEEHGRRHMPLQPIPVKFCLTCGRQLVRRQRPKSIEPPAALAKRSFCNSACHGEARRGKPRGWSPANG